jgi:hypothetical protein
LEYHWFFAASISPANQLIIIIIVRSNYESIHPFTQLSCYCMHRARM